MSRGLKEVIGNLSLQLEQNYKRQGIFEVAIGKRLPKRSEIIDIVNELRRIMYPGFFGNENTAYVSLEAFAGNSLAVIYEKLFKQVKIALLYKENQEESFNADETAEALTLEFLQSIPVLQEILFKDVEAELEGDPAAKSKEEVIFSYPGIFAVFVYRIANQLYRLGVPFIPRIMTEYAHGKTGIDINPGAEIGEYFFIDHGTGIVIGETTRIGNHVKIYQGVTLGALSIQKARELVGVKRHPTIEDNVVIYANTTVLGGNTIVGKNSVVAGNSFIIESIPPNTKVLSHIPELKYKNR